MNQHKTLFVTGIGTDVGKTIASSILTESLQADYWKPIQAGNLDNTDSQTIQSLISNTKTVFHEEKFLLKEPQSPHLASVLENITIKKEDFVRPKTQNHLIIEGAGGLLVPLHKNFFVLDLITKTDYIVVVSKHYLGSINHTLLTLKMLEQKHFSKVGILFIGNENVLTENIIQENSNAFCLGRIPLLAELNPKNILQESKKITKNMMQFLEIN